MIYLLVIVFAAADRLIGWGGFGRTKPVIGMAAFTAAVAALAGHNWQTALTLPLAFIAWRSPGWGTFGGSLNPETPRQVFGTLMRHMLVVAFYLPAFFASWEVLNSLWFAVTSFAVVATILAGLNAKSFKEGKDINGGIEIARGAILGLFIAIAFNV